MKKLIIIILFFFVSFSLGANWIAMKIAVKTIPPIFATSLRFLLVSPLLIVIAYINNITLLFPKKERFFQFLISFFYFSVPFALMIYAAQYINNILSALIFSNIPVLMLINRSYIQKEKIQNVQIMGVFIVIVSFLFFTVFNLGMHNFYKYKGWIALLCAALCHSYIYVYLWKKKLNHLSVITFNALPSLLSGITLLIVSICIEHPSIYCFSYSSIKSILFLSYCSGFLGIVAYFYLQKEINSFYASTVFLTFPIIVIILEHFMYRKYINIYEILLIIFFIFGSVVAILPNKKLKKSKN
ncbi:EamA-like transporter family protein [Buchnera aphidicola (Thelaxes suberi)]|uniref:DMT family transporter n=1 Tax=Buchnera aphidicola TaxID=9 RepID=UPI003463BD91